MNFVRPVQLFCTIRWHSYLLHIFLLNANSRCAFFDPLLLHDKQYALSPSYACTPQECYKAPQEKKNWAICSTACISVFFLKRCSQCHNETFSRRIFWNRYSTLTSCNIISCAYSNITPSTIPTCIYKSVCISVWWSDVAHALPPASSGQVPLNVLRLQRTKVPRCLWCHQGRTTQYLSWWYGSVLFLVAHYYWQRHELQMSEKTCSDAKDLEKKIEEKIRKKQRNTNDKNLHKHCQKKQNSRKKSKHWSTHKVN